MKYFNSADAKALIDTYKFSIFPIHGIKNDGSCTCNNSNCTNIGKHPATPDGFKSASNDIEQVKRLWAGRKGLNVGVATGKKSGIFVIDIDSVEGEKRLYERFNIPVTYTVTTGKGKHLYFAYPDKEVITKKGIIDGVDVRGDGGYVAGQGSNHASGVTYSCVNPLEQFAICPNDLLELCLKQSQVTQTLNITPTLKLNTREGWTIEQVREHLSFINPDVGYDEWVKVGMALQAEGLPFELFDTWSKSGLKYDNTAYSHWKSFSAGGGVSYGTIVVYAKEGGWMPKNSPPSTTVNTVVKNNSIKLQDTINTVVKNNSIKLQDTIDPETGEITELRKLPLIYASDILPNLITNDFVEDLLCEEQFSVTYGESNCGKTFAMLDLAMHVALGREYRGKHVEQGAVLYCALEGGQGTQNRIVAFKRHYNIDCEIPLAIIPSNINFLDNDGDILSLLNAIETIQNKLGKIKLIIIDTLARAMSGADENSGQDMGQMIINADAIREITKAHINFVHHSGKDTLKGARGHSSLRAAVDTEIEISRPDTSSASTIKVVKQREIEMIDDMAFTLDKVVLGLTKRDKEVTSCIVTPCEVQDKQTGKPLTAIQKFVYEAIVFAVDSYGYAKTIHPDMPPQKVINYDEMREVLEQRGYKEVMETKNKTTSQQIKSATQSARVALKKQGKINCDKSYIWLVYDDE